MSVRRVPLFLILYFIALLPWQHTACSHVRTCILRMTSEMSSATGILCLLDFDTLPCVLICCVLGWLL